MERQEETERTSLSPYVIQVAGEDLLHFERDLPAYIEKRTGKRPARSVIYRWKEKGLNAGDGVRIPIPTIKVAGSTFTSTQAVQWWAERLTFGTSAPSSSTTPSTSEADLEVLREAGIEE